MFQSERKIEYLDVNGILSEDTPKITCGYHAINRQKESFYIKLIDGVLYHPNLDGIGTHTYHMTSVSKQFFEDYQKFLQTRNDITYNRLNRSF